MDTTYVSHCKNVLEMNGYQVVPQDSAQSSADSELRKALEAAYLELKKHDADYHYRTPAAVNSMIVDALRAEPQTVARSDRWLSDLLLGCTEIDVCTIDYATNQHVRYRLTDDQKALIATSVIEGLAEQPAQSQAVIAHD